MPAILIAFAETGRLRYTENVVSRAGYRVVTALGGGPALQASLHGAEPLDLLILDPAIEQTHGDSLRTLYPRLPVLVLDDVGSADIIDRIAKALSRPLTENA